MSTEKKIIGEVNLRDLKKGKGVKNGKDIPL